MAGRRKRYLAVFAVVAAAVLAGGQSAGAAVIEKGAYTDNYSFEYNDCGFDVVGEGTVSGHFRIRTGKGKLATAFFLLDNYVYTETHTNPETGDFLTIKGNTLFNEVRAKPLGGNIFEFTAVEAGQPFAIYDSAGNLVLRDRGALIHHAVFDTEGDDVPGGIFLEDLGSDVHGPHPGFDTDFCELITPLIGS
jgi:hypothetical protein